MMKKYIDADLLKEVVLQRQFMIGQYATWYILGLIDSMSMTEERVVKDYCEPRNYVVIAAEDLHALEREKDNGAFEIWDGTNNSCFLAADYVKKGDNDE